MSWRPTSRRSVDSAGSGTGETAQKTPSALGSGTPSSARGCLHRGGHRFESPPLHEEVRANRRDFLGAGPGARDESGKLVPLDVKAGDRVLFGKWSGAEVKIDGEELMIMKESDIMGVIDAKSSKKK